MTPVEAGTKEAQLAKRKPKASNQPEPPLPPPSKAELEAIEQARARIAGRRNRARVKIATGKDGKLSQLDAEHSDAGGFSARLQDAFGSRGLAFPTSGLNHLIAASRLKDGNVDGTRLNALLAIVDGLEPVNEVEAMLAVQLAVAHGLAMELLLRAQKVDQIPQLDCAGNLASKMLRAIATHVELLNKLKGGGKQTVRVEHVHVHPGAQAIVGNVSTGGRGGEKSEHQPHAPHDNQTGEPRSLTHEPGAAMPSMDASREPVPVASGPR